jgi:hypothetical protein
MVVLEQVMENKTIPFLIRCILLPVFDTFEALTIKQ